MHEEDRHTHKDKRQGLCQRGGAIYNFICIEDRTEQADDAPHHHFDADRGHCAEVKSSNGFHSYLQNTHTLPSPKGRGGLPYPSGEGLGMRKVTAYTAPDTSCNPRSYKAWNSTSTHHSGPPAKHGLHWHSGWRMGRYWNNIRQEKPPLHLY